jgi:S-disulfanyl-L-cysteine oxidoreductase SoxD
MKFTSVLIALFTGVLLTARAQGPTYGMGRIPTGEEVKSLGISVSPDGAGLPPGSGTAVQGAEIFARRCGGCHGAKLEGTKNGPGLVGGKGTLTTANPVRTVGSFWPYAPPIFDYIKRAMPVGAGGSLMNDEAYALTALILARNELIAEDDVIDARSLPKVKMPNRDGFVPARLEDINKQRCRVGTCR